MSFSTIKKTAVLSLILFTFTMFVGCGGDEAKIKSTANGLISAMKKGDMEKAQKFLTKEGAKEMKDQLKDMKKEEKEMMVTMMKAMFADAKIGEVKVEGDKATLKFTTKGFDGKDSEEDMNFVKEGGKWKANLK